MLDETHPALVVARSSWRCVQAHEKQAWLDLMADDVCIEDPIGVGPTNPSGEGIRGKAEVGEFYDKHIASSKMHIETHESFLCAGNESAHVMTLTTTLPNGVISRVKGIFTYKVNDEGKLTNMRGYWNMDAMDFEQPG